MIIINQIYIKLYKKKLFKNLKSISSMEGIEFFEILIDPEKLFIN